MRIFKLLCKLLPVKITQISLSPTMPGKTYFPTFSPMVRESSYGFSVGKKPIAFQCFFTSERKQYFYFFSMCSLQNSQTNCSLNLLSWFFRCCTFFFSLTTAPLSLGLFILSHQHLEISIRCKKVMHFFSIFVMFIDKVKSFSFIQVNQSFSSQFQHLDSCVENLFTTSDYLAPGSDFLFI